MLAAPTLTPGEFSVYFNLDFKLQLPLLQELTGFDLEALDRHYEVPVYYLLGDQDWQTPYPIAPGILRGDRSAAEAADPDSECRSQYDDRPARVFPQCAARGFVSIERVRPEKYKGRTNASFFRS